MGCGVFCHMPLWLCAALIDVPGVALYPPHAAEEEQAAAAVYEVEQEDQEAAAKEPGTIF